MPLDFLGQELKVGRLVIFPFKRSGFGLDIEIGEIKRFTKKMMFIHFLNERGNKIERKMYSYQAVLIDEKTAFRYSIGQKPVKGIWVDV